MHAHTYGSYTNWYILPTLSKAISAQCKSPILVYFSLQKLLKYRTTGGKGRGACLQLPVRASGNSAYLTEHLAVNRSQENASLSRDNGAATDFIGGPVAADRLPSSFGPGKSATAAVRVGVHSRRKRHVEARVLCIS